MIFFFIFLKLFLKLAYQNNLKYKKINFLRKQINLLPAFPKTDRHTIDSNSNLTAEFYIFVIV